MIPESNYYVYAYYEPYATDPFYIGKGKGNRAYSHLEKSYRKKKTRFYKKLNSLINSGIKPEIEFIEQNLIEEKANEQEIFWIKYFGRIENGGTLYNLTDGGDGTNNHRKPDKAREKKDRK